MLYLTRRRGEKLIIRTAQGDTVITFSGKVQLEIEGPFANQVIRGELDLARKPPPLACKPCALTPEVRGATQYRDESDEEV